MTFEDEEDDWVPLTLGSKITPSLTETAASVSSHHIGATDRHSDSAVPEDFVGELRSFRIKSLHSSEREATIRVVPSQGEDDHVPISYFASPPTRRRKLTNSVTSSSDLGQQLTTRSIDKDKFLDETKAKLEAKLKLKKELVDHPLAQFWGLFTKHFLWGLWNTSLEIRTGTKTF